MGLVGFEVFEKRQRKGERTEIKLQKKSLTLQEKTNRKETWHIYTYFLMSSSGSIPPCLQTDGPGEKEWRGIWRGRGNLQRVD